MRSPSVHPARIASVYSLSATRAGGRVCRAAFIMVRSALSVPSLRFDFAAGQLPVSLFQDSVSGVSLEVPGTSASRDGP